jgi:hypothetical protein
VQVNGDHYQYTMEDLSIWAMLIVRGYIAPALSFANIRSIQSQHQATLDMPPDRLKLADKCVRQAQMKKRAISQPTPAPLLTPLPAQPTALPTVTQSSDIMQMMMVMLGTVVTTMANSSGAQARNRPCSRQSCDGYSSSSSPPMQPGVVPSKHPKSPVYMDLKAWLHNLEANVACNKYNEKYSQYSQVLVNSLKLYSTEDIITLSPLDLSKIGGMEFGVASRLICFAREDAGLEPLKKARSST